MDIDFDFDSLSWTDELDHSIADVNLDVEIGLEANPQQVHPGFGAVPLDFLFAEDESALVDFTNHNHTSAHDTCMHDISTHMSTQSANAMVLASPLEWHPPTMTPMHEDPTQERLRSQLSLLSQGSCGDELVFKNCDSSKAMLLHGLSMEFGLKYSHDFSSGEVSVARAATTIVPFKPTAPSSTLPVTSSPFPALEFIPKKSSETSDVSNTMPPEIIHPPSTPPSRQLTRRLSRSQRISDSISRHVSTWKTSISKNGGRKGPLTEDGRRDMKVLEGAGGACWRCKVLRRKVSLCD